jgi:hypothetical protein
MTQYEAAVIVIYCIGLSAGLSIFIASIATIATTCRSSGAEGPTMSDEDSKDELERLRKENETLKKGASSEIRMKVSEKGGVSVYGMGRFPVTLYKEQWLKLLDMSAEIRAFISANDGQLKKRE